MKALRDNWNDGTPQRQGDDTFVRPPRVEDVIPRHANPKDKRPRIWLPNGEAMKYYSRPSSWGKKAEDTKTLSDWDVRVKMSGMLDYGNQSEALQLERSALGPSEADQGSKQKHNALYEQAKDIVETAARVGTAWHTITERWDLGLPVNPPPKFKAFLEEWKRLTQHFEIVEMPDGRPGVEVFVAFDQLRPGYDGSHWTHWVRLAGTFDRLWRYKPCDVIDDVTGRKCGRRNYIGDLKTGKESSLKYNGGSYSVQEGVYAYGDQYVPWDDGKGATRTPLPDVCRHRAITLSLPSGTGQGEVIWTNIAAGYETAVDLIPRIVEHRRRKDWYSVFAPVEDPWTAIDRAHTEKDLNAVWQRHPYKELWAADNGALTQYATARKALIMTGEF
jgi:hypothetical protein